MLVLAKHLSYRHLLSFLAPTFSHASEYVYTGRVLVASIVVRFFLGTQPRLPPSRFSIRSPPFPSPPQPKVPPLRA